MRIAVFLFAESIFNLGLSVFFLLYNLHLLDLGFNESFLGAVASLLTAGSVCGTLPAGWFSSRFGVGAALRVTFAAGAAVCALQAWAATGPALLSLAFASGLAAAFRAVTIAPAVSQLSTEANRSRAFSWFFALGIGMGALGGLIGGRLPLWMTKQAALWAASGFAALALIPTFWLHFAPGTAIERKPVAYPRNAFVKRYLAAAAVWHLFVGAFPSFFNVYFARRYAAGTSEIGLVFSVSQVVQVSGTLLAPAVFARIGLVRGIGATQAAAACFLVLLAPTWTLPAAGAFYAAYMSCQYMNQPGWHTLLMNRVSLDEQSGASSLNFFVIFSANAVAALLFGWGVATWGYAPALLATAAVGIVAAMISQIWLR